MGNKLLHVNRQKTAKTLQNAAAGRIPRDISTSLESLKMHRNFLKLLTNYSSEKKALDRNSFSW